MGPEDSGVSASAISLLKDVGGPITAAFGATIAGAFISYRIQGESVRREELRQEARAYNSAISILSLKLNEIVSYKKAMVVPYQNDPLRFITMPSPAIGEPKRERAGQLVSELILEYGSYDLLSDLNVAEEYYLSLMDSLRLRFDMVGRHRDRMEGDVAGAGRRIILEDIVRINGVGATIRLYAFSEGLIEVMDDAISKLSKVILDLSAMGAGNLRGRGGKIILINDLSDPILTRTCAPHFKDVEHLAKVIDVNGGARGLVVGRWKPSNSIYVFKEG